MQRIFLSFTLFVLLTPDLQGQQIAITLDDAPTPDGPLFTGQERTQKILRHLRDNGVAQVTFFVITRNIDKPGKARLEQYTKAGHLIGNHTNSHEWIHNLGVPGYNRDVEIADSILRPMKGFIPWFRYPFLDEGKSIPVRDSIRTKLKDLNLINGYVTIDNYDWYLNSLLKKAITEKRKINYNKLREVYIGHLWQSIQFYDQVARRTLGRSPRHILLIHENDLAARFLGDLITHLKSKGWKIISPVDAYQDPIASQVPDVLFNGQGRVAAIAREKGSTPRDLVQSSEDEEFLDKLVKTKKVFE